jgi:hypothetical protein
LRTFIRPARVTVSEGHSGAALALLTGLIIVIAGAWSAIVRTVEILAVTVAVTGGAAAVAGIAALAWVLRHPAEQVSTAAEITASTAALAEHRRRRAIPQRRAVGVLEARQAATADALAWALGQLAERQQQTAPTQVGPPLKGARHLGIVPSYVPGQEAKS